MKVLLLSFFVIFFDQISKLLVRFSMEYARPYRIVGNWLRFTYIENPGMAFGIQVESQFFFIIFALLATIVVFIYLIRARFASLSLRITLALILGGAIGNLIDRILYGKVVDFIEVLVMNRRWPVFNIADIAVTIGMILLIWLAIFEKKEVKMDSRDNSKGTGKVRTAGDCQQ